MKQEEIMKAILSERDSQYNRPGSEYDLTHSPGDWMCIISHYVNQDARRNGVKPDKVNFRNNLIRAGAVVMAALEHLDVMVKNDALTDNEN